MAAPVGGGDWQTRSAFPGRFDADVAQLVAHGLAKSEVAGSKPVVRSHALVA